MRILSMQTVHTKRWGNRLRPQPNRRRKPSRGLLLGINDPVIISATGEKTVVVGETEHGFVLQDHEGLFFPRTSLRKASPE